MAEISHDSKALNRGVRRLAAAVLIHALEDLVRGSKPCRRGAFSWFTESDTDGMSFEFCCTVLGRDANTLRDRLGHDTLLNLSPEHVVEEFQQLGFLAQVRVR